MDLIKTGIGLHFVTSKRIGLKLLPYLRDFIFAHYLDKILSKPILMRFIRTDQGDQHLPIRKLAMKQEADKLVRLLHTITRPLELDHIRLDTAEVFADKEFVEKRSRPPGNIT